MVKTFEVLNGFIRIHRSRDKILFLICLTKSQKYNNLELLVFLYLERITMHSDANRFPMVLICLLIISLFTGCLNRQSTTERLYFEPPLHIIADYGGMVEVKEVNWAWLRLGDRFGRYRSVTIKPFKNLTSVDDQNISQRLYEGVMQWFDDQGVEVSDTGELICKGALVAMKLERNFLDRYNPLYEDKDDLSLEVEIVMTERFTDHVICKIRHGVTGYEVDMLVRECLNDLLEYFESHK